MTIVNPYPLPPYTWRPYSNITPFTYRDGWTYLEVLESLRCYITDVLVPSIDENESAHVENVQEQIDLLTAYVDEAITGIIGDSVEVQDAVVAGIVTDTNSLTYDALMTLFNTSDLSDIINTGRLSQAHLDATYAVKAIETTVSGHTTSINNLNSVTATHTTEIDELQTAIGDVGTGTSGLAETVATHTTQIDDLETLTEEGRLSETEVNNTITGIAKMINAGVGVKVYRTTEMAVPAGSTEYPVIYDAEVFDTSAMHAAGDTKLFVPDVGGHGFYMIIGQVEWKDTATGVRTVAIKVNGGKYLGNNTIEAPYTGHRMQVTAIAEMYPGDYVELLVSNGDTVAHNIAGYVAGNATFGYNSFSLVKVISSITDVDYTAIATHFSQLYFQNQFTVTE